MELKIGLIDTAQGIELEMAADTDADEIKSQLDSSIGGDGTVWLTDKDGNQYGVSAAKIAFVKIGVDANERRIGFGV